MPIALRETPATRPERACDAGTRRRSLQQEKEEGAAGSDADDRRLEAVLDVHQHRHPALGEIHGLVRGYLGVVAVPVLKLHARAVTLWRAVGVWPTAVSSILFWNSTEPV